MTLNCEKKMQHVCKLIELMSRGGGGGGGGGGGDGLHCLQGCFRKQTGSEDV